MLLTGLTSADGMATLEASMRFAAQRQRLIAHNIANLTTPDFRQVDADPRAFQRSLGEAVERDRAGRGFVLAQTREMAVGPDGALTLTPRKPSGNILAHDRNNRDLEGLMKDLAENALAFRVSADLMRGRMELLRTAISQRV